MMWFLIHAVIKVYSCYSKGPLVYNLVCYSYEVIISSVKTPWSATTARVSGYQTKGPLCLIGKLRLIICVCDKQTSVYSIIIVFSFTMVTSSNGNIFRVTGHLCGEFPVNSLHKGQWRGALMFSLVCVWINGWGNNRGAGDSRRYRAHYDVIVMHQGGTTWALTRVTLYTAGQLAHSPAT